MFYIVGSMGGIVYFNFIFVLYVLDLWFLLWNMFFYLVINSFYDFYDCVECVVVFFIFGGYNI